MGAEARRAPAPGAAARRRRERPAGRRPAGVRRDRPRHRGPPRHHAGDDRQRALQRLRPAPRLDDLHADQPVPRGARGRSPSSSAGPAALDDIYVTSTRPGAAGAAGAAVDGRARRRASRRRSRSTTSASFRRRRSRSTSRAARRSARRSKAIEAAQRELGVPASVHDQASRARRSRSAPSLANELLLILAAIVTMYIVLGVLYESYIHPITILSTLPSAGVGALLALMLAGNDLGDHRDHRHHPADRHREEERDHDDRLRARRRARARAWRRARRSSRRACCASGRS